MHKTSYLSRLDVDACRAAIQEAARPETVWLDTGLAETPVFRVRGGHLNVRFKRALVRAIVHNWFELNFSAREGGGTTIEVEERIGLGRGWWVAGVVAALFSGIVMASERTFWPSGFLFVVAGGQSVALAFSAAVTCTLERGDRERLAALLTRVAGAQVAA